MEEAQDMGAEALEIRPVQPADYTAVRAFLVESSNLYPGIEDWWENKVAPGLQTGERVGWAIELRSKLTGLFLGRRGERAKICSLRLKPFCRGSGLGTELLKTGILDLLGRETQTVYVTISEAVLQQCMPFFEGLGFSLAAWAHERYVKGIDELVYSCPSHYLARLLNDEPVGLTRDGERDPTRVRTPVEARREECPSLSMSLKPEFAQAFLRGEKTVEFRRRFSRRHVGRVVLFYVSKPVGAFAFKGRIENITRGLKEDLWATYNQLGGIGKDRFDAYFADIEYGYALEIGEVQPLRFPISAGAAKSACSQLTPAQSFKVLKRDEKLAKLMDYCTRK